MKRMKKISMVVGVCFYIEPDEGRWGGENPVTLKSATEFLIRLVQLAH